MGDLDGSETYVMQIVDDLPSGAKLYGADGAQLHSSSGLFILQPADVESLHLRPPLHWSSPVQGDITLSTRANVTDTSAGRFSYSSAELDIVVSIIGVADKPNSRAVNVVGREDVAYNVGAAVGDINTGVLVDVSVDGPLLVWYSQNLSNQCFRCRMMAQSRFFFCLEAFREASFPRVKLVK